MLTMSCGFVTPATCTRFTRTTGCVSPTTARRQRPSPQCVMKKLLVVDLQELLRGSGNNMVSDARAFSERVEVDRNSAKDQTYVLFSSSSGFDASVQSINDAQLVEPDALATLSGTELYQRGYKTPDPYWGEQVQSGWTPRPVEWVASKFFSDEIKDIDFEQEYVVKIRCKGSNPSADFCSRMWKKLREMGIPARVVLADSSDMVHVVPAASSPAGIVAFCQMMLSVPENSTFVFGGDDLINACVQGKGNVGLCPSGTEQRWDAFDGRVYVSKDSGIKALMDGVLHHAVF